MKEGLTPSKIDHLLAKLKPHPVVAIVDDDPDTLELLERTLEDEGYEVHRFERAEDFLARSHEIKADALVMEAVLSGMNGLSVLDELRPKSPESILPVLILSKNEDPRSKLLAFRRGASDYVIKPFDPEEVAARVRSLVRTRIVQEMIHASAISDPLTSLYNSRFLLIWLQHEMARVKRYGLELSSLLLDLDHFREINERNGEKFGDFLLKEFATLVTQNTRHSDIVGRLQNDEFLIFLPGTSKEQAMLVARRLRLLAAKRNFKFIGKSVQPSFCIGIIGCHSDEAPDPKIFLDRGEEALAKAKAVGFGETAVLGVD